MNIRYSLETLYKLLSEYLVNIYLDLDLGSGHTAYHHASLVDLYVHTKMPLKSKELFADGRTDGRTDISDRLY